MMWLIVPLLLLGFASLGTSTTSERASSPLLSVVDPQEQPGIWNASVTIDLSVLHEIAPTLFGIFFEEIGHAGDGGLYAEMIQDRSFDATAAAAGFSLPSIRLPLDVNALASSHPSPLEPLKGPEVRIKDAYHSSKNSHNQGLFPKTGSFSTMQKFPRPSHDTKKTRKTLDGLHERNTGSKNNLIVPWVAMAATSATLTRELPLNPGNQVAMEVTVSGPIEELNISNEGGLINFGYWGIAVQKGESYAFSIYIRNPQNEEIKLRVALTSADLATEHATLKLHAKGGGDWQRYEGTLQSSGTDTDARLVLSFKGPATLIIDFVSLFPLENVEKAWAAGHMNPYPFRKDLLQALKDLTPGFLRFPGGCYVEGDWMRNAFQWKKAIGGVEERPGHYNLWG